MPPDSSRKTRLPVDCSNILLQTSYVPMTVFYFLFLSATIANQLFLWKAGRIRRSLIFSSIYIPLMFVCLVLLPELDPDTVLIDYAVIGSLPGSLWLAFHSMPGSQPNSQFVRLVAFLVSAVFNTTLLSSIICLFGKMTHRQRMYALASLLVLLWPVLYFALLKLIYFAN